MDRRLRANLFAVNVEHDIVLLDVVRDQYLCLVDVHDPTTAFRQDRPVTWSNAVVRSFDRAGLLEPGAPGPGSAPPPLPSATIIHAEAQPGPPRPGMLVCAAAATSDVHRARRHSGLAPLLALATRPGSMPSRSETVFDASRRFWSLLPWLPIQGECLIRSALLVRFLALQSLSADWVFGVRLWPFSAHCWVQCGDVCLNDDPERLIGYTPILSR